MLDTSSVRAWAVAEGLAVSTRGRISRDVVAEYLFAHPADARVVAAQHGIAVPTRGRVSFDTCVALAAVA